VARPRSYTKKYADELAEKLLTWVGNLAELEDREEARKYLFIERFCYKHGFPSKRLKDLQARSKTFAEAYELFKDVQKAALQEGGLTGEYTSKISALLLSHDHNVREKKDIESPLSSQLSAIEQMLDEEEDDE